MSSYNNTPCLNCGETKYSIRRDGVSMCALPGTMHEADDHIGYVFPHHRWVGWSDDELDSFGVHETHYEQFRHTRASTIIRTAYITAGEVNGSSA